jgi:hypothetical protein
MSEVIVVAFDSAIHVVALSSGHVIQQLKSSDATQFASHHALDVAGVSTPNALKFNGTTTGGASQNAIRNAASALVVVRACHVSKALVHTYSPVQVSHQQHTDTDSSHIVLLLFFIFF